MKLGAEVHRGERAREGWTGRRAGGRYDLLELDGEARARGWALPRALTVLGEARRYQIRGEEQEHSFAEGSKLLSDPGGAGILLIVGTELQAGKLFATETGGLEENPARGSCRVCYKGADAGTPEAKARLCRGCADLVARGLVPVGCAVDSPEREARARQADNPGDGGGINPSLAQVELPRELVRHGWRVPPLVQVGELKSLVYGEQKRGDGKTQDYIHEFGRGAFVLADSAGPLVLIAGGGFTVEPEGITG